MSDFARILVPTDFGPPAKRALGLAIDLAERFDSDVLVCHVYSAPHNAYFPDADALRSFERARDKELGAQLDEHLAEERARWTKIRAVAKRAQGAWEAILELATAEGCTTIVMGTHGRQGFSRLFLGSVAEAVVRHARLPVLTVCGPNDVS